MPTAKILISATLVLLIACSGYAVGQAERYAEMGITAKATGGETMAIDCERDMQVSTYGDIVLKDYETSLNGKVVRDQNLDTYTLYRERDGDKSLSISSDLNQWISLPGYFSVDMSNSHNSIYIIESALMLEDLQTDMTLATTGGQKILKIQPAPGNSIGYAIDNAMRRIDQQWYNTYCAGQDDSGSKRLEIGMSYRTAYSESNGPLSCDYGHENSASKSIEFQ